MKTSWLLFLIGSVAIIGGGIVAFKVITKPAVDVVTSGDSVMVDSVPVASDTMTGSASIADLMSNATGKNMECTFVFVESDTRNEGTGFFADGKVRVDMLNTDEFNVQAASYMIMNTPEDTMYVWTLVDGEQTGMKMSISENEKLAATMQANIPPATVQTQSVSPKTAVQYSCKPWSPDLTVFIPPSAVEFMDMSEMQKMMGEMTGGLEGVRIPGV